MIESGILETAGGLGVGAFLGALIFVMFWRYVKYVSKIMAGFIERDQESREKNTEVLTELITYLRAKNGGH